MGAGGHEDPGTTATNGLTKEINESINQRKQRESCLVKPAWFAVASIQGLEEKHGQAASQSGLFAMTYNMYVCHETTW
jgi:hypothetical protein